MRFGLPCDLIVNALCNRRSSAARRVHNIDHPVKIACQCSSATDKTAAWRPTVNPPTRCTTDGTKLLPLLAITIVACVGCQGRCQHVPLPDASTMVSPEPCLPNALRFHWVLGSMPVALRRINPGRLTKSKGGERLCHHINAHAMSEIVIVGVARLGVAILRSTFSA